MSYYRCKGTHEQHYSILPNSNLILVANTGGRLHGWTGKGMKRCSTCEFLVNTIDRNCKCCGVIFRIRKHKQARSRRKIL